MTKEEIINGLQMSIDLILFDPTTGEVKEPHQLNDIDRTSYEAFKGAMEILAQPQRMRGQWVPEFNGRFTGGAYWFSCSRCKRIVPEVRNGGWNYCPECGADMRGVNT